MKYKVLILTDHRGHTNQNSIYALAKTLAAHDKSNGVYVVSRGVEDNSNFFERLSSTELYGTVVTDEFAYSSDGVSYISQLQKLKIDEFDIVLMRMPRPISDWFLQGVAKMFYTKFIVNDPIGIMETSTKEFLLNFPVHCPAMMLCKTVEDIKKMVARHGVVLKPLKEYGGRGIVKIIGNKVEDSKSVVSLSSFLEKQKNYIEREGYLAMQFLKNVSQGDKRILVVGGEIMACSIRLPATGSWLCNVAQGGSSIGAEPTPEEIKMIAAISPKLLEKGIYIYGADTLVNDEGVRVLSEINTLSIGGFPQAEEQTGRPILKMTIDKIIEYADEFYA